MPSARIAVSAFRRRLRQQLVAESKRDVGAGDVPDPDLGDAALRDMLIEKLKKPTIRSAIVEVVDRSNGAAEIVARLTRIAVDPKELDAVVVDMERLTGPGDSFMLASTFANGRPDDRLLTQTY